MRKKLIAAIIVVLILLAVAIGVIIYMEQEPNVEPEETTTPASSAVETTEGTEIIETTEETVGISLPTENPDDVTPEATFSDEDIVPPVTGDVSTGETEDRDSNETPEDEF